VVVSLFGFVSEEAVEWSPLMASVVVAIIPVVILQCGQTSSVEDSSSGLHAWWKPERAEGDDSGRGKWWLRSDVERTSGAVSRPPS